MHAHCIGNFVGLLVASKEESEKDVANMVVALRKGLSEFDDQYAKRLKGDEAIRTTLELLKYSISLFNKKDEVDA
ncbi:hypothetical protein RND71_001957 [Anisodus tanguticus]|uniref:Uncharacterized protein n=1 Tax=Anisodus tanguticus TaxID=243964 RepID=A0AAE1VYS1_9SOLA|nr:hypothetical protein RND71_001957 [Anisodus tanguticus]